METLVKRHKQQLANLRPTFRRQRIDQIQWNERLVGIKGERGVGKTTLCFLSNEITTLTTIFGN